MNNEMIVAKPVLGKDKRIESYVEVSVPRELAEYQLSLPIEKRNSHWREVKTVEDLKAERAKIKEEIINSLSEDELQRQLNEIKKQKGK
ncbi:MAG: hypothetical protein J7604_03525 [Sporocytophaga sp.]|uniref:hypothetical protein n=1 Tax=Sporocytophaga sp. TaxID=2231183 RepID=UPI001B28BE57|nr:hypothetical protein [Sporocytophaga sp.]MBO9699251.1 hypothetical protein [Sporocytophaga sp.]